MRSEEENSSQNFTEHKNTGNTTNPERATKGLQNRQLTSEEKSRPHRKGKSSKAVIQWDPRPPPNPSPHAGGKEMEWKGVEAQDC